MQWKAHLLLICSFSLSFSTTKYAFFLIFFHCVNVNSLFFTHWEKKNRKKIQKYFFRWFSWICPTCVLSLNWEMHQKCDFFQDFIGRTHWIITIYIVSYNHFTIVHIHTHRNQEKNVFFSLHRKNKNHERKIWKMKLTRNGAPF